MVAIMRHIAREHDLIVNPGGPANTGDGEEAATRQDMAEQQVQDFRKLVIQLCYTEWVKNICESHPFRLFSPYA
jgi:hypothetical protein